jgi:hypothetical protein
MLPWIPRENRPFFIRYIIYLFIRYLCWGKGGALVTNAVLFYDLSKVCEPEISAVSKFSAFDVYAAIETSY